MSKMINLVGLKIGRLTVISLAFIKNKNSYWKCLCDCGNEKNIAARHLRNKMTKSCGCLQKEITNKYNRERIGVKKAAKIIKELDENKALSNCIKHGVTTHYNLPRRSLKCCLCSKQESIEYGKTPKGRILKNKLGKKRRLNPINNFADKLRIRIRSGLNRTSKNNKRKIKGCFRNLDYDPKDLYYYLENTRNLQDNKCPVCDTSYNNCIMTIEHVIPLAKAKTEQEIIDLFDLKNLSLMCKSCNSSKCDIDYNTWMDS